MNRKQIILGIILTYPFYPCFHSVSSKNTKKLNESSPRLDCIFVMYCPVKLRARSDSIEDGGIVLRAMNNFVNNRVLNLVFAKFLKKEL